MRKNKGASLRVIQDRASREIAQTTGITTCKPRCSACCHQWIGAFWAEGVAAVKEAKRLRFPINTVQLEAQSKILQQGVDRQKWFGTPCIFLTADGLCGVYRARPMTCRGLVVKSDPRNCMTPSGKVLKYETKDTVFRAYDQIRGLHEPGEDIMAPLPVIVDFVLRDKTAKDLAAIADPVSRVVGLHGSKKLGEHNAIRGREGSEPEAAGPG